MTSQFLVPLKEETVLPWSRLQQLYDLSLTDHSYFRFGIATGIPVGEFPDLVALSHKYGLKDRIYIIRMTEGFKLPIHVDGSPGKSNAASLIWPFLNCDENSPTQWYSLEESKRTYEVTNGSYFLANSDQAQPIHKEAMYSSLRSPYLFRSDILHRGFNPTALVRVVIKWEMMHDRWEDAVSAVSRLGFLRDKSSH